MNMKFSTNHLVIATSDISKARSFYIDKLKLDSLENGEKFFAARLGDVRLSFFGGCDPFNESTEDKPGISFVMKVDDIDEAKKFIEQQGIKPITEIIQAGDFMKFFNIEDPDGNTISIGQYLADPLQPK
ncbi:MAG: VOC family protein [Ignavibacteria bacterium]